MLAVAVLGLAGCASRPAPRPTGPLECVPFARSISKVQIRGDAADWWSLAEGRYRRTQAPAVGGVLVFRRTQRLQHGHVSVVSRVVSGREILVSHANWVPDQVDENVPVVDISPANDWTRVRVWWPPAGRLGVTEFPTFGFVEPAEGERAALTLAGSGSGRHTAVHGAGDTVRVPIGTAHRL
jgi:surface antigen